MGMNLIYYRSEKPICRLLNCPIGTDFFRANLTPVSNSFRVEKIQFDACVKFSSLYLLLFLCIFYKYMNIMKMNFVKNEAKNLV
jgi:hypothetical protein